MREFGEKIGIADRIAIFIGGLLLALTSLFGLSLLLNKAAAGYGYNVLYYLSNDGRLEMGFISILFLFLSIYLIRISLRNKEIRPILVNSNELGDIQISLGCLYELVKKSIARNEAVGNVSPKISMIDEGLIIDLKLHVKPDMDITTVCEDVQNSLKQYLQETAGISVHKVGIIVKNIAAQPLEKSMSEE